MPIPDFTSSGLLPPGVFDCTLEEVEARYGRFSVSDRRRRLFARLRDYISDLKRLSFVVAVFIDGSFVTDVPEPNDIDLILELRTGHDVVAELRPFEYNCLSGKRVRKKFGFDVFAATEDSADFQKMLTYFQQVRDSRDLTKGLVRIEL